MVKCYGEFQLLISFVEYAVRGFKREISLFLGGNHFMIFIPFDGFPFLGVISQFKCLVHMVIILRSIGIFLGIKHEMF